MQAMKEMSQAGASLHKTARAAVGRRRRKLVALGLSLALALSLIPAAAFADTGAAPGAGDASAQSGASSQAQVQAQAQEHPPLVYPVPLDEAHFPDPVFRDYIEQKVNVDANGMISEAAAKRLVQIRLFQEGLTSLEGIQYFTELLWLNSSYHRLSSIDLYYNTKLETVSLFGSYIPSIDVSNNKELKQLDLTYNELTSLDVSNNPKLEQLSVSSGKLSHLDISNNPKLKSLKCAYNSFTAMDYPNHPSLEFMECDYNPKLTSINLSGCAALKRLDTHRCYALASIDLTGCTKLEDVRVYENALTKLDLSDSKSLKFMECRRNPLGSLDLSGQGQLTYLDCSYNSLSFLDVSDCVSLKTLECNNNSLLDVFGTRPQDLTKLNATYQLVQVPVRPDPANPGKFVSCEPVSVRAGLDIAVQEASSAYDQAAGCFTTGKTGRNLAFTTSGSPYDVRGSVSFNPVTANTPYAVEHYKVCGGAATLVAADTESASDYWGATVSAAQKDYAGYDYDPAYPGGAASATVAADGSTVLRLYYVARQDTPYSVEHWLVGEDGAAAAAPERVDGLVGETDSEVAAAPASFPGHSLDPAHPGTAAKGTVAADGSLVLRLFYAEDPAPAPPTQPTQPTQPGTPAQPGTPTQPTQPGTPVAPAQPTQPGTPGAPAQPTQPAQPMAPSTPSTPAQPTQPVQPTQPAQPTQPTQPVTPAQPTQPGDSGNGAQADSSNGAQAGNGAVSATDDASRAVSPKPPQNGAGNGANNGSNSGANNGNGSGSNAGAKTPPATTPSTAGGNTTSGTDDAGRAVSPKPPQNGAANGGKLKEAAAGDQTTPAAGDQTASIVASLLDPNSPLAKLTGGSPAIALGLAIFALGVLALASCLFFFWWRRRKDDEDAQDAENGESFM
jgi:hypothetical protein